MQHGLWRDSIGGHEVIGKLGKTRGRWFPVTSYYFKLAPNLDYFLQNINNDDAPYCCSRRICSLKGMVTYWTSINRTVKVV